LRTESLINESHIEVAEYDYCSEGGTEKQTRIAKIQVDGKIN
jgi:hypothetical protein